MPQPWGGGRGWQPLSTAVPGAEPGPRWRRLHRGNLEPWCDISGHWELLRGYFFGSVCMASLQYWAALLPARAGTVSQGGSRAPQDSTGCWRWGWVILEPGAAPLLVVGLGPALSRLLSALPSECRLPGQGKQSLLSPRDSTHAPGVQSRSARLCRLWECSESPQPCAPSSARRLARTRRHPGLSCQGFSSG